MNFYALKRADNGKIRLEESNLSGDTFSYPEKDPDTTLLRLKLYSFGHLEDVINGYYGYSSLIMSEKCRNLIAQFRVAPHDYCFLKAALTYKKMQYSYYNCTTIRPTFEAEQLIDFEKSLFHLSIVEHSGYPIVYKTVSEGNYQFDTVKKLREGEAKYGKTNWSKSTLYITSLAYEYDLFKVPLGFETFVISENLKNALEAASITGINIEPLPNLQISAKIPDKTRLFTPPIRPIDKKESEKTRWNAIFKKQSDKQLKKFIRTHQQFAIDLTHLPLVQPMTDAPISRFFGRPHVSANFEWPTTQENGRSLVFIAQINTNELKNVTDKLNGNGMIAFFMDIFDVSVHNFDSKYRWRVFYFKDVDALQLADFPVDMPVMDDLEPQKIYFNAKLSIPAYDSIEFDAANNHTTDELDGDKYLAMAEKLLLNNHQQMLGYHTQCQGDPRLDITDNDIEKAKEYELLFQFQGDKIGLDNFLDDGMCYFFIQQKDRAVMNFDNIKMIAQWT
jgi:uncharacterized protein YwqG